MVGRPCSGIVNDSLVLKEGWEGAQEALEKEKDK